MSGSYASRLSEYTNKGVCGLPERTDKGRTLTLKMNKLMELVKEAKRVVVLTGAGISTSAGIPDFRGPSGIWTMEQQEKKKEQAKDNKKVDKSNKKEGKGDDDRSATKKRKRAPVAVDFDQAAPTLTHRALTLLVQHEKVHFIVTQNVDGLHRRSGLSRDHHAVLHGCVFTEICSDCRVEHFRNDDVGGMSFQKTGRHCDKCGGDLKDCLLDWEDALPEFDFERSQQHCTEADLVITLGTSLRIEPAGSLPTLAKKFAIVNLQVTPYDNRANLIIRSPVDEVMSSLIEGLGYGSDWDDESLSSGVKIERYWTQPEPVEEE